MKQVRSRVQIQDQVFLTQNPNQSASLGLGSVADPPHLFQRADVCLVPQLTWAVKKEVSLSPHSIPLCAGASWLQTFNSDKGRRGQVPPPSQHQSTWRKPGAQRQGHLRYQMQLSPQHCPFQSFSALLRKLTVNQTNLEKRSKREGKMCVCFPFFC